MKKGKTRRFKEYNLFDTRTLNLNLILNRFDLIFLWFYFKSLIIENNDNKIHKKVHLE